MSIESILLQIDAEITRLSHVRLLLANLGNAEISVTEPATKKALAKVNAKVKAKKKRILSPEARQRIADAQRKRWAAQKTKSK